MQKLDIRVFKTELRSQIKKRRLEIPAEEKARMDALIASRLYKTSEYRTAGMLVTYVSTPMEIDTLSIIRQAWKDGKRVVVPRCIENCLMDFHEVFSMQDLSKGTFSVLEPDPQKCPVVTDFFGSVCLVPGLTFDWQGFRLGYGKGYYDRFLCRYPYKKIGLIYEGFIKSKLPRGRFDVAVDFLLTETHFHPIKKSIFCF